MLQGDPDSTTVSHALTAVFRQHAYDRSIPETILGRIFAWVWQHIADAFRVIGHTPGGKWIVIGVAVLLAVAIIVNVLTSRFGDAAGAEWRVGGRRGESAGDPWTAAQRLAAAGNYTDAAHALYQGLLRALARRDNIRLHESKTVGDYTRDLRARSSQRFAPFREFARTYEVVVYGLGTCDYERYERLHALALSIAAPQHG